jgi:hypothetical protein
MAVEGTFRVWYSTRIVVSTEKPSQRRGGRPGVTEEAMTTRKADDSGFRHAVDALQKAYDALIAREWEDVNSVFKGNPVFVRALLSVPRGDVAALDFPTGWEDLRRAVDRVSTFHRITPSFAWMTYGSWRHSFAHPTGRVSNWIEYLREVRDRGDATFLEREITGPMREHDEKVRKKIGSLSSEYLVAEYLRRTVPKDFIRPIELWPVFKTEMKAAKNPACIDTHFVEWLQAKHNITLKNLPLFKRKKAAFERGRCRIRDPR